MFPKRILPVVKGLEEFSHCCVAFPTGEEPSPAALSEKVVAQGRDALVRLHPVAIAAAEHCIFDPRQFESVEVGEPLNEVCRVIRRLSCGSSFSVDKQNTQQRSQTFEGSGDDHHRAISGHTRCCRVKRPNGRAEACSRTERVVYTPIEDKDHHRKMRP